MSQAKKDYIVSVKTKTGIEISIDSRVKDDIRLLYLMSKLQSNIDDMEKNKIIFEFLEFIFGTKGSLSDFLNVVAEKHDGVADPTSLFAELNDIFEALNVKNS